MTRHSSSPTSAVGTTSCCMAMIGSPWRSLRIAQAYMLARHVARAAGSRRSRTGPWCAIRLTAGCLSSITSAVVGGHGGAQSLVAWDGLVAWHGGARRSGWWRGQPPAAAVGQHRLAEEVGGRELEALAPGDRQQLLLAPGRDGAAADPAADGGLPDAQQLGDALLRAELADDVLDGVPAHRGSVTLAAARPTPDTRCVGRQHEKSFDAPAA